MTEQLVSPAHLDVSGKRVTIMGLGLLGGGAGAARFLAARGARVTVTDKRDAAALRDTLDALRDLPITFTLGRHEDKDFLRADLVVVNPAVPPASTYLQKAVAAGVALTTEINLLMQLCPAPVAAVTGSNGKSTTTSMLADMLRAAGRRVWLGGNLGGSLLESLDAMRPDDLVVLELSSFQLERLAWLARSPRVAVVCNLTPNHLDRHGTMAEYGAAKKPILLFQQPGDAVILNHDDPIVAAWAAEVPAGVRTLWFGRDDGTEFEGVALTAGDLVVRFDGTEHAIPLAKLRLPGEHNRLNAAAAAMAAFALGASAAPIGDALAAFTGLEHRLQLIGERDGVRFYNDSIATNPESVIAAIQSFAGGIILIAGGQDKKLCYDELGRYVARRVRHTVLLGRAATLLRQSFLAAGTAPETLTMAPGFDEAVREAIARAKSGDVVLMSPACASYDMFRNFEERGHRFRDLVQQHVNRA